MQNARVVLLRQDLGIGLRKRVDDLFGEQRLFEAYDRQPIGIRQSVAVYAATGTTDAATFVLVRGEDGNLLQNGVDETGCRESLGE